MDKINDIEEIISSNFVNTLYIIYAILTTVFLLLLFWIFKRFFLKKEKKINPFDSLNFDNPNRDLLYNFTVIAKEQKCEGGLNDILKKIEPFKYSNEEIEIPKELIEEIREYVKCQ